MSPEVTREELKEKVDNIIKEDKTINVPLKDLIWTMVAYSYEMKYIEDKMFSNYPLIPDNLTEEDIDKLANDKEYLACKRSELARLIKQYSDFDTRKIWEQIDPIFNFPGETGR